MNSAKLLDYYARIADAPSTIERLRRFILDLAVRGKLVEQDAVDEPVGLKSLDIITKRRGQIRDAIQAPFALPDGWAWRAVDTISDQVTDGEHSTPPRISERQVPLVTAKNVRDGFMDYSNTDWVSVATAEKAWGRCKPLVGDILLVCVGATTGRLTVLREPADMVLVRSVALIRPNREVDADYLERAIRSPIVQQQIWASVKVSAQPCLYINRIQSLIIPLPPLTEQLRIVAKVDELMALCDQLEAARAAREAARDTFSLSTLARLNEPDPGTFHADARFTLANVTPLTIRADQIKQLRQTILNLAMRGKLVAQDGLDEPSTDLVQRIRGQVHEVAQSLRLKVPQALPQFAADEGPFPLPPGWCWARFPELGAFGRGRSKHRPRNDMALYANGSHFMIQTGDVARSNGRIKTHTAKYNEMGLAQSRLWPEGTLCITIAANIADTGILEFPACFPDSVVGFVPAPCFENARYFEYFMRTAKADLLKFAPATAQKNINLEILMQVTIPLPPLAEQQRIVAKVDELMALCDQLEASITMGEQTRSRLLEAVLHDALAPSDKPALPATDEELEWQS